LRLKQSITDARYSVPSQVETYLMSEAHSRFGAGGLKSRSTRSSATLTPGTPNVVRNFRRFT
jgi:hypothetical protein